MVEEAPMWMMFRVMAIPGVGVASSPKAKPSVAAAMLAKILSFVLFAFCWSAESQGSPPPVAWWSFDDPARLGHDLAGTNEATLVGSPGACSGVIDGGVFMNGAGIYHGDYLRVPDSPSLEITGPLTVLVWANANVVDDNYTLAYKATQWDDGQMAYMLDLNYGSGGYSPRFAVSSNGYASGYVTVISTQALTTGEWHLIGGVYDGTNLSIYIDGQLRGSRAYAGGIYPGTDPLDIGRNWNTTWNGALDEVRIFDVALAPAEMLEEFQTRGPVLNTSLLGYFGRVLAGQTRTSAFNINNTGDQVLEVAPIAVSGPDAQYFKVLTWGGGFLLQPGLSNGLTAEVEFAPDSARAYNAVLTVRSSANSVVVPLTGQGYNDKAFTLDLRRRNSAGDPVMTRQEFHGSQLALLVVDMWDSHPDSEMASRTAGLVPRLNQALDAARDLGISIIFCPSDCLADFEGTSYRSGIMNCPFRSPGDNGFDPPLPPYIDSAVGNMVPPNKTVAASPMWAHQHPDLVLKPGDVVSLDSLEIFLYCAEKGINTLLYTGVAANMCVVVERVFSMIQMKRYCDLEPIMVRDLTSSMTLNGRSPDDYSVMDLTMTPDRGHREVTEHNETYICATTTAAQLMQKWAPSAYTCLISTHSNLLCYWRLDSKGSYRDTLDIKRTQSCWWYDQTNGLVFEMPGAVVQDPDTAMQFKGSTTVLVGPIYRDDIPTNSPLAGLSANNFTLETWVQFSALNTNQWFYAHDVGYDNGVDVLLGLNSSNHFQFAVGVDASRSRAGDVLVSATAVTPEDVASNRWFHLVAVHDITNNSAVLYVNGNLDREGLHVCQPVSMPCAPHLGSRGLVAVDESGKLVNPGFEFLQGTMDEVAIYNDALGSDMARLHYQTAQGRPSQPVSLSARRQGNEYQLSWPAFSGGLWLQASDSLEAPNWQFLSVPVLESNGTNLASLSITNSTRFFRLGSQ